MATGTAPLRIEFLWWSSLTVSLPERSITRAVLDPVIGAAPQAMRTGWVRFAAIGLLCARMRLLPYRRDAVNLLFVGESDLAFSIALYRYAP